jgi:hypothetical protein
MSNENSYDWAAQAGRAARESKSKHSAQKASDKAEMEMLKRIADQKDASFRKKSDSFLLNLSNRVQFAVNTFNGEASEDQHIDSPLLTQEPMGLLISYRKRQASQVKQETESTDRIGTIQTTVELSVGKRSLTVFHIHRVGRDDRETRLARAKNHNQDDYSIDSEAEGGIVVTRHGSVVSESDLVVQICTPIFEYVGASA